MWVQVSGMIGANSKKALTIYSSNNQSNFVTNLRAVYQPSDKPRYFKANKGLLVICIWMCVSNIETFLVPGARVIAS
jgi:hypothetical protein